MFEIVSLFIRQSKLYLNKYNFTLISFATKDFPLPGGPLKIIAIFGGLF